MITEEQLQTLHALLPGKCTQDAAIIEEHSRDKWDFSVRPDVVVFAEKKDDIQKLLQWATEQKIPVTARGGGVGYVGGCVPVKGGIVLSLIKMNKILEIHPIDGIARVEAGVITGDLQDAVRELGWFYPPDPASLRECTIGGNIATNAGGPRCLKYGVTKNYILGLEVILSDGRILKLGGRTHKNKTGFDLASLFCGSEGLLGIISEATLRIIPQPPSRGVLSVIFPEFSDAALAVQTIFAKGHLPAALEITDTFTLKAARDYLGSETLPEGKGHLLVEIDGREKAVQEELNALEILIKELKAVSITKAETEKACEDLWHLRRQFSYSLKNTGMKKLNEDIVVPRSELVNLVTFCQGLVSGEEMAVACFGHSGDGNIHTNIMVADYSRPDLKEKGDLAVDQLFNWVLSHGGSITGEHGIGLAKSKWITQALDENTFAVHRLLKETLDPHHLLNPGKMGLL